VYFVDGFVNIGLTDLREGQGTTYKRITDGTNGTDDMLDESETTPGLGIALTITDDKTSTVKSGETITYTFTFDEAITGFNINDITISGGTNKGTLTSITGETGVTNGTKYTLEVTPNTNFEGDLVVSVARDAATAANGKKTSSASNTQAVDTITPTATVNAITEIAGTDKIINATEKDASITIKGTLSAASVAGEKVVVTINGKSYDATNTIGEITWTVDIPQSDITSIASGDVTAKLTDMAGNASTAKTESFTVNTAPPLFESAAIDSEHTTTLTLAFNEALTALDISGAAGFRVTDDTVTTGSFVANIVTKVVVADNGLTAVLTLTSAVAVGKTVKVTYDASEAGTNAIKNKIGNTLADVTTAITTIVADVDAPNIIGVTDSSSITTAKIGETLSVEVIFSKEVKLAADKTATVILVIDKTDGGTAEVIATATGAASSGTTGNKLTFVTATLENGFTDTDGIRIKANSLSVTAGDLT
ncbi:MAG: hypothetical protein FE834_09610, partial [Gammaproteobacteria bacterium]|nr:hypothetical protein [Gammaproteobacteria bacterium]